MPAAHSFLAEEPVRRDVADALAALVAGVPVPDIEHDTVDFKEDPSRRGRHGELVTPGPARDDRAALYLADEAACMSNSGGGAMVVGVEDATGAVLGTGLDVQWLRGRIHDLSERRLTCAVEEVVLAGSRLLVIVSPPAQEPIRVRGRAKHRVGGRCVEIDASRWMEMHVRRLGFDWSAQPSQVPLADIRAAAVEVARRYLRASGEEHATELASTETADLLRRLGALDADDILTNGAALLFTARAGRALVDYRRREVPGGDSLLRLDRADVSLLEAVAEAEQAIGQVNRTVHIGSGGLAVGQIRALPENTIRKHWQTRWRTAIGGCASRSRSSLSATAWSSSRRAALSREWMRIGC